MVRQRLMGWMLGAGLATFVAAPALAAGCAQPTEHQALDLRVLQTELMVGALTCGLRDSYNSFVNGYHTELSHGGKVMKTYFDRTYGKDGGRQMNRFVTSLANETSTRSLNMPQDEYCAQTAKLYALVMKQKPGHMANFVSDTPISGQHGIRACETQTAEAAKRR